MTIKPEVAESISKSVKELIDLVQQDNDTVAGVVLSRDSQDTNNWVVSAMTGTDPIDITTHRWYRYAIYINGETGHTDTDGY